MDFQKFILYTLLAFTGMMLWTEWVEEHAVNTTHNTTPNVNNVTTTTTSAIFNKTIKPTIKNTDRFITVKTDVLNTKIDLIGGNIVQADLINYSQTKKDRQPVQLLSFENGKQFIAQSGLISKQGPDSNQAQAKYQSDKTSYILDPKQNELVIDLKWRSNDINVIKRLHFKRNDYAVNVEYIISNQSAKSWQGSMYSQLVRQKHEQSSSGLFGIKSYEGASISSTEKPYEKISYSDMQRKPLERAIKDGWLAMQQHYFLSAWVPTKDQAFQYYTQTDNDFYTLGALSPSVVVKPNQNKVIKATLYIGPEIADKLERVAPHLKLTIDYGWFWFISEAIFWVMAKIYDVVGNWGWAIILTTVLIKLGFYQLSASSYRSMARMRHIQPKLQALKERYSNDRQRFSKEVMELYKREKVNPFGGCLPILIQIPVFIALYWVLIESVELRHAPFFGWIQDLSARDPYFVLPILMGISMLVQQKLNPPPPDPLQAKMLMSLPIVFTVLFLYFPSGLVLYWVVNNILSILQQWVIMKRTETVMQKFKST